MKSNIFIYFIIYLAITINAFSCYKKNSKISLRKTTEIDGQDIPSKTNESSPSKNPDADLSVNNNNEAEPLSNKSDDVKRVDQAITCKPFLKSDVFNYRLDYDEKLCAGKWQLSLKIDGTLSLMNKCGLTVWSNQSTLNNKNANIPILNNVKPRLIIKRNGVLVIQKENQQDLWTSSQNEYPKGTYTLNLTTWGFLHMTNPKNEIIWIGAYNSLKSAPGDADDVSIIKPRAFLISNNGLYKLLFDKNGNLKLLDTANGFNAVWKAVPEPSGAPTKVVLQNDGNLVIFTSKAAWSTNIDAKEFLPPFTLKVNDAGYINIIDTNEKEVWSSLKK